MSTDIQSSTRDSDQHNGAVGPEIRKLRLPLLIITLMMAGRMMTLPFIARAGGAELGDPPAAWLMPLVGDAVVGLAALAVAYLLWTRKGLGAWVAVVGWNLVALWDALSAFLVHQSAPWPSFFMIEIFGASMFFIAAAMHALALYLASRGPLVRSFFTQPAT